jgi:glyoxylase-like metal-dependent hydrolase (beta-lactamase superfamily II)
MPEHNSAATEHAIMEEITAPLASLPDDPVGITAAPNFPVVLRGYDRLAVDAYVKRTAQLVAELHTTRSPEAAVRRALERVGEQISGILQRAHETAEQITATSRAEAEDRLQRAREEAEEIKRGAELKVRELDADTDRIWAERHRIMADVHRLGDELHQLSAAADERFPAEPEDVTRVAGEEPTIAVSAPPTRVIDVMHLGRERVIGCWQVGDVLVDPGPSSCLETLLAGLGEYRPRALLLTHIHLDHAGASGSLVQRWPELEVYVHERGAAHLADPSRLLESAARLYGDDMDRLWGEVLPVPEANLRILHGGETLEGGFEVAYTPGHASHHVSYLHNGIAFVGDIGGVRIVAPGLTIPSAPPPDIDIEAWHDSLDLVAGWRPQRLAMTHFGASEDVERQLTELRQRLDAWSDWVRTADERAFVTGIEEEIVRSVGPEIAAAYVQAAPPKQLYAGLERYWRKRAQASSPTSDAPPLS